MAEQHDDVVARALAAARVIADQIGGLDLEGQPYDAVHLIYAARDELNGALEALVHG